MSLIYGLGINNGKYPAKSDKKHLKEYSLWCSMLSRCSPKMWLTKQSYTNTTLSDNFKDYSYFYEWCQGQVGFGNKDENGISWHLDKDLLVKGNKLYSEVTCIFIPSKINNLLTKREYSRGSYPIGVYLDKRNSKFMTRCSNGLGKDIYLGSFKCPIEAFKAYKTFKENYIKQIAEQYKLQIDSRVYKALVNYEVEITD